MMSFFHGNSGLSRKRARRCDHISMLRETIIVFESYLEQSLDHDVGSDNCAGLMLEKTDVEHAHAHSKRGTAADVFAWVRSTVVG